MDLEAAVNQAAEEVRDGRVAAEVETAEGVRLRLARPLETDVWIYRLVVGILGAAILAVVGAALALKLVASGTGIPDVLVAIGTGAIGALAGLLAPSPGSAPRDER